MYLIEVKHLLNFTEYLLIMPNSPLIITIGNIIHRIVLPTHLLKIATFSWTIVSPALTSLVPSLVPRVVTFSPSFVHPVSLLFLVICLPSNSRGSSKPSNGGFPWRPGVRVSFSHHFPSVSLKAPSASSCLPFPEVVCFCWF